MLRQNISQHRFSLYSSQKIREFNFATQQDNILFLCLVETLFLIKTRAGANRLGVCQVFEQTLLILFLKLAFKVLLAVVNIECALIKLFQYALPDIYVQMDFL